MTERADLIPPRLRESMIGRADVEAQMRKLLADGALANGWLITGPRGAGKATLAYRLARAILEPSSLAEAASLDMPSRARAFRLIAQGAHPDLFVAEREYDEKNQRYQTEIPVDRIRDLNAFLSKTASTGEWRVAIIDSADDLNRQAANALLKSLEEPPAKTAVLLLSSAPGRLLATVRSRCRRIGLPPVAEEDVIALLREEAGVNGVEALGIAKAANGRPGYALSLAAHEGAEAVAAVDAFLQSAMARGDAGPAATSVLGKAGASKWEIFTTSLLERISADAREAVINSARRTEFDLAPDALIAAHDAMRRLIERGEAVNLDRSQILGAIARVLKASRQSA